jgi:hypothetical protein
MALLCFTIVNHRNELFVQHRKLYETKIYAIVWHQPYYQSEHNSLLEEYYHYIFLRISAATRGVSSSLQK